MQYLLILCCYFSYLNLGYGQNNTLSGKVVYPTVEKKIKIKRGANYRNRLSSAPKKSKTESTRTKAFNTIISLHPISFEAEVKATNVKLIQKDKTFAPQVLAVTVGSKVSFINEDKFYHNVFSLSKGARFNIGRKKPGVPVAKTFSNPGVVEVFCDIHPHMNAKILCLDTPFYTSVNEDGTFLIAELPNGKYRLEFYNPDINIEPMTIDFQNGQLLKKNFIIDPESSDIGSLIIPERWLVDACCTGTVCSNN